MALKGVLTAAAALVGVVALLVVVAVSTGYVVVDDPAAAASEVLSGDVQTPEVQSENWRIDEANSTAETFVFRGDVVVNNTMNAIGGSVDVVEYDVYVSGRPDEGFERIGEGDMRDIVVEPGNVTTRGTRFEAPRDDVASAMGASAVDVVTGMEMYMRVDGVARLRFGPFAFEVEFTQTQQVQ